jgi:hypothetical protein
VREEGWLWVELMPDASYGDLSKFHRVFPKRVPIPKDVRKELKALRDEYDELAADIDDVDEAGSETRSKLELLQKRIDELTPKQIWSGRRLQAAAQSSVLTMAARLKWGAV